MSNPNDPAPEGLSRRATEGVEAEQRRQADRLREALEKETGK